MIGAAGALVFLGLGLFVAGIVTDTTALYWSCVGACAAAGVLLVLARSRQGRAARTATGPPAVPSTASPAAGEVAARDATPADEPFPPPGAARAGGARWPAGDPPVEEVEVTDLLLVVDLRDEVLVVDEHPRYHLSGCPWLAGRPTLPLPVVEARSDGFTPCARCAPDRHLADRERGRRAGRGGEHFR